MYKNCVDRTHYPTRHRAFCAVTFLAHTPLIKSSEQFGTLFVEATQTMTREVKKDLVIFLLDTAHHVKYETILVYLFKLINHFNLQEHPELRKHLVELHARRHHSELGKFIDVLLAFVQREMPRINQENPLFTMVREYLIDLPEDKLDKIDKLLNFGKRCIAPQSSIYVTE